ncbi:MAG: NBR1-Ig-like domain-containing protein [Chloroflexi bacterium]|nr:NBR1-Ig-like domain-containing protein [Chloroflexota bacterium]
MNTKLKHRNIVIAAVLLVALMFGFMPAPQAVSATTTCDWAQFVADVTVPDGTYYSAGATFNKTWRLKNIGTCTWTTGYSVVFVSGTQMGAAASTNLPTSVAPGATIDLTLPMTAPSSAGAYRGNWQLKNASAVIFGIGPSANLPFWVEINVSGTSGGTGYDFVSNGGSATWTNGAGTVITFGAAESDNGFAKKLDAPVLENGSTDTSAGLLTGPQNIYGGTIQGIYPAFTVQSGDHFQSIINCEYNATACYVNFRLNYQVGTGPILTYWTFNERYEGLYYRADIDLSALAGQSVKFILYVGAAGYPTGDRALWGAPRITRGSGGSIATATPGPTPTVTPATSTCDRATFISDVNVPDGTVFGPNSAFTKTWRIKNTGSCTWTTGYKLVFVSGNKMSGADSTSLTSTIGPNTSYDFSVNLTSPSSAGSYRGYWQLKNASNQIFGIGYLGNQPWWVDIVVNASAAATSTPGAGIATATPVTPTPVTPAPGTLVFDFTNPSSAAVWTSGAGSVTYGDATDPNTIGIARKLTSVQIEDGSTDSRASLLTVPQTDPDGYIQGVFPAVRIHTGDKFQATIACQFNATNCFVTYRIGYQIGAGAITYFSDLHERYEGLTNSINIALPASLDGQDVKFILRILARGSSTDSASAVDDRALWIAPRIIH